MRHALLLASVVAVLALGAAASAQTTTVVVLPGDVTWSDMKEMPGWQIAVLAGDPTKPGPYVARFKIPANAMVPPHTHPDTENITVLSGALGIGEGNTSDKSRAHKLPAGAFYLLPASTPHFAWTDTDGAVIQVHGIGPTAMTMLNPPAAGTSTPAGGKQ